MGGEANGACVVAHLNSVTMQLMYKLISNIRVLRFTHKCPSHPHPPNDRYIMYGDVPDSFSLNIKKNSLRKDTRPFHTHLFIILFHKIYVFICFFLFSRRLGVACGCHRLGVVFVCRHRGAVFICVKAIQTSKVYIINDKKSNQWSSIY